MCVRFVTSENKSNNFPKLFPLVLCRVAHVHSPPLDISDVLKQVYSGSLQYILFSNDMVSLQSNHQYKVCIQPSV